MRSAGWVFAWLTWRESARSARTRVEIRSVKEPKHSVADRLHNPQQTQAESYTDSRHDLKHNLDRFEPLYNH
jgi:hypothetical protein